MGSREMARALGLESTRCNRLLKTLAHLGIAQQNSAKQYVPGPGMHVLAAQAMFGSGLLQRAIGPLESLRAHRMSVAMGVLWRDDVSYLYHSSPGDKPSDAIGRVGLFPATRSGIGLALLARLPVAEIRTLYRQKPIPHFADGVESLLKTLARVRERGYATIEPFEGQPTQSIAVALDGESVAIALSGKFAEQDYARLSSALQSAAAEIVAAGKTK